MCNIICVDQWIYATAASNLIDVSCAYLSVVIGHRFICACDVDCWLQNLHANTQYNQISTFPCEPGNNVS